MTKQTSHALETKYKAEQEEKKIATQEAKKETTSTNLDKLPKPTGWRLLVMPFAVKEETKGGEIRMLNDDEVLGTINDPEDLIHAM